MTTIAANTELIACDSRCSDGASVFRVSSKIVRIPRDGVAGFAGQVYVAHQLIEWMRRGMPKKTAPVFDDSANADVLWLRKDGTLWLMDQTLLLIQLDEPFHAIGSGAMAARAAMRCGASPVDAVAVACEIDPGSSLPVKSMPLKPTRKNTQ